MILIEFLCWIFKKIYYYTARPIIWFITARDCRHCKHGRKGITYHGLYGCTLRYDPDVVKCRECPWRPKFERR